MGQSVRYRQGDGEGPPLSLEKKLQLSRSSKFGAYSQRDTPQRIAHSPSSSAN